MSIAGQNALINQYIPTFLFNNLVDGETIIYDSTRRTFVNVTPTVVSSPIKRLGDLLDVNPSVDNPLSVQNGQALVYDSTNIIWKNAFIDYNLLLNKPTSSAFSFIGLSDTTKPSTPNGYVLWNNTGTELIYSTTIPASSVTGLATVATTGNFNDLSNKPTSSNYDFIGLSDTAKPSIPNGYVLWNGAGTQLIYSTTIPVANITGLAAVATVGTFASLTDVSPTIDTAPVGYTIQWDGAHWVPAIPQLRVVATLGAMLSLTTTLGSQAYVVNSDDGMGDYVNQWSLWIYTITGPYSGWTLIARQPDTGGESATIQADLSHLSPGINPIGTLPTGGRIVLITVEVTVVFNGASPTLEIDYTIPASPSGSGTGILMPTVQIDLTTIGIYSTTSDILFGTDTPVGDIDILGTFVSNGSTAGAAQIIVSYV